MSSTPHVTIEPHGPILRVALNRPEKRNALTHAMYTDLVGAIARADEDPNIRVLFLTGTHDCFTSGNDMADFMHNPPKGTDSPVSRFLAAIRTAKKPIVAAVNGPAVGVGTTMLLHFDLVFAGRSARFLLPFVSLGLCPEAGSSLLLPLRLGHTKAAELLLLGEPFDAEAALAYGIVNAVYDDDAFLDCAWAKAERLAAQPPAAVRLAKAQLKAATPHLEQVMSEEGAAFTARLASEEAAEAMGAFLEKRKPDFSRFS